MAGSSNAPSVSISELEEDTIVSTSWFGGDAIEAGRGGGTSSGGGGSAGGSGSGFRMLFNDLRLSISSSFPSFALGTMSDRNSKSSEDKASELIGLDPPKELRLREKRVRNLETAVGGGWGTCVWPSTCDSGASAYENDEGVGDGVERRSTDGALVGSS